MAEVAIAAISTQLVGAGLAAESAFGAFLIGNATAISTGLFYGAMLGVGEQQRKAASRRARNAYNASLTDRMVMLDLQPDAAATIALGRVRTVEGVRRRFTTGTHGEKLTLIVSFAGHEIDAFEQFYFNDQAITLDGSGWVQEEPYNKSPRQSHSVSVAIDGFGNASYDTGAAIIAGSAAAVVPGGADPGDVVATATIAGTVINVTGTTGGANVTISWQTSSAQSFARIRTWLGTDGQNVGAALAAEYPGKLTATDRFAGIALAVVDLTYDPDVFPHGIPNITAVLRGAKVLDPRTSTTAWSENPALHAYHLARHAWCWGVPVDEIRAADINTAATVCEPATTFTLHLPDTTTDTVVLPRYRCGIVINTAGDPRAAMDEVFETMAGRWGWAGGTWRMRAGTSAAPVVAMDEGWFVQPLDDAGLPTDGSVLRLTNGVARESKVNRVNGRCVDSAQRHQILPFPSVADDVLIAADGEYPVDVEFSGVNHIAHAQHLARIAVRQNQAALRMEASCGYQAWRCELFDVLAATLPRYGFSAKPFEVAGWRWHPTAGVTLQLEETAAAIYEVADLDGRDPAPNGGDVPAWQVEALALTSVTSGTPALTDGGSIITRTLIEWGAAVAENVRVGGSIEVQYIEQAATSLAGDWPSWMEAGRATTATIPGLRTGIVYLFRVRAISAIGVRGRWSNQVAHLVADAPATGGSPLLLLTATGFVFVYSAVGTSDSPDIQFTARLINAPGPVSWSATAFDAVGTSLGPVSLSGAGSTRFMDSADLAAVAGARYAEVTASFGALSETVVVNRFDADSNGFQVRLTNLGAILPATSAGVVTDYTDATGVMEAYQGALRLTNLTTPSVVFSIPAGGNPDGITGTFDAITGAYAATAMPDAIASASVTLRATSSAGDVRDVVFKLTKSPSGSSTPVHYFSPLTELVAPIDNTGAVVSFAGMTTNYIIARGATEEQASWTLTPAFVNCTGTLVGNKITVTALASLGGVLSSIYTTVSPLPTGWANVNCAVWCDGAWALIGNGAGGTGSLGSFATSANFVATTARNNVLGSDTGRWNNGAFGAGVLIAVEQGNSTRVARSTDKGVTWAVQGNLSGAQNSWTNVHYGNKFILTGATSGQAAASPTGAAGTWAVLAMPAAGCRLTWHGAERWAAISPAGNVYLSTNGGSAWGAAINAGVMAGAAAGAGCYFRGLLFVAMAAASTKIYRYDGAGWGTLTVPAYRGVLQMYVIRDVLYLVDLDYHVYTCADGQAFKAGATLPTSAATALQVIIGHIGADIDYLPIVEAGVNQLAKHQLGATSDSAGRVDIQASKAGQTTVVKSLPVRKGSPPSVDLYAFSAFPAALQVPATADGVVTGLPMAITAAALLNGQDNTAAWAWSWTASAGLTPASGTGNVATLTAMATATASGTVTFKGSKQGQPDIGGPIPVSKIPGADVAGIKLGSAFLPFSHDGTYIAVKFTGDGRIQVKRGSAGAYQTAAYWRWPVDASIAATHFVRFTQSGEVATSGTFGAWLALTTDREVVLERVSIGTYQTDLQVDISQPAAGQNAVTGFGSLRLIVP